MSKFQFNLVLSYINEQIYTTDSYRVFLLMLDVELTDIYILLFLI